VARNPLSGIVFRRTNFHRTISSVRASVSSPPRDQTRGNRYAAFVEAIEKGSVKRDDFEKHTPMNRIASAEEVASVATWLCSDAASYVTGVLLPVEGGRCCEHSEDDFHHRYFFGPRASLGQAVLREGMARNRHDARE
jgi:hypothetical protein